MGKLGIQRKVSRLEGSLRLFTGEEAENYSLEKRRLKKCAHHFSNIWMGLVEEELGILLQKQEQMVMGKHISSSYSAMDESLENF